MISLIDLDLGLDIEAKQALCFYAVSLFIY